MEIGRPDSTEHAPYYARYIQLVPENDVVATLESEINKTLKYLREIPESSGEKRYAPDKWSVKEVLGHMIDTERIMGQRALFFARNAQVALPGYEPDDFVNGAAFGTLTLRDLSSEFEFVRRAHVLMFRGLSPEAWMRRGIGSGNPFSVRALAFIIVGHERHHMGILKERYMGAR